MQPLGCLCSALIWLSDNCFQPKPARTCWVGSEAKQSSFYVRTLQWSVSNEKDW